MLDKWLSVLCIRSKAWLAARVSFRLAHLPRTASSAQRSRRLRSTRAAAPVLLAHAEVTNTTILFSMGQTLRYNTVDGAAYTGDRNLVQLECDVTRATKYKPPASETNKC